MSLAARSLVLASATFTFVWQKGHRRLLHNSPEILNPAEQGQEWESWNIGKRKGKWRTREKDGETGGSERRRRDAGTKEEGECGAQTR
ncbi:hypothetical protein EI555_014779 [Monodon monoceros]|uniref:Uncharacterized protein n=1 Tax=Monodon monoceros TaxID=40151 RepID=A0A4U1FQF0_MONMO|nr:hypothetical protein EI555_014779 [Monodon monoceros]